MYDYEDATRDRPAYLVMELVSGPSLAGVLASGRSFTDYLTLRLVTTLLALLIMAGLVLVGGYAPDLAAVLLVVGLAKAFEALSDIFYGLLQHHEQMDRIAISMMIKGALSLLALAGGVYLTGSLVWGVVGMAGVWRSCWPMIYRAGRACCPVGHPAASAGLGRCCGPTGRRAC